MERRLQAEKLHQAGASEGEVEELLAYDTNVFAEAAAEPLPEVPLADEPFAEVWGEWAEEARREGAFAVLRRVLPQLAFPIAEGMSQSDDYRAATLRGVPPEEIDGAAGLELERPEAVELELYPSFAGRVPMLVVRHRADFVTLVRALGKRNEPVAIPPAQGALMIAGYNNWQRIARLRQRWEEGDVGEGETWNEVFANVRKQRELYQDRFMILSDGPYSAVAAADLGLGDDEWRRLSLVVRREHECTHYFTRRLFGAMRNHLLDELMADYVGLVTATGRFRADWFLRFVGLEGFPRYREGARLDLYRGDPPLSDGAFAVLHRLVVDAAHTLERFDTATWPEGERDLACRARAVRAIAGLSLVELASKDAVESLCARL